MSYMDARARIAPGKKRCTLYNCKTKIKKYELYKYVQAGLRKKLDVTMVRNMVRDWKQGNKAWNIS